MFIGSALLLAALMGSPPRVASSQTPGPVVSTAPPEATSPPATASPAPNQALILPANTVIPVELRNTVSSRTAYVGQPIYCDTIYPITVHNRIVVPVGSFVKGEITQVVRPGRVKGKAQIGVRFTEITLASGLTKPLHASLSGFGSNGNETYNPQEGRIQGESSKGKDAETVAITTAEGAGIGSVAGISSKHTGLGAATGASAGAVGGLVYVLVSRGKEVVLPKGTDLQLQLAVPLTYEADELDQTDTSPNGPNLGRRDPGPGL